MPPAFVTFLKSTGWRSLGALLVLMAIGAYVALFSYDPQDPTINNVSSRTTTNLLGPVGANVADVLMQTLAMVSFLLPIPVILWGQKIARLKWLPHFWLNLMMVPVSLILIAIAVSVVSPAPDYVIEAGYGGALGQQLYGMAVGLFPSLVIPAWAYGVTFAALGIPAYLFSFAFNRDEWRTVLETIRYAVMTVVSWIVWGLKMVGHGLLVTFHALFRRGSGDDDAERVEPEMTRPVRKAAEKPSPAPVSSPVEKRVKAPAKPKRGTREVKEAQKTLDFGDVNGFRLPPLELLAPAPPPEKVGRISAEALEQNARMLESVLDDFGVQGEIKDVRPGPVVTLYELEPARGVKSARVIGLADDIARSMSAISARVAVVPGRNAIGIELPNVDRQTVFLRELLASRDYEATKARLPVVLGKDIGGAPVVADLASMPHLLVAGTTGSGKSVGINTMILSLLYRHSPETLRFIMVDPKMLELSIYDGIPHLLTPVVTEPKKAVVALKWAVREMEERYRNMSKLGVRNLAAFNKRVEEAKKNGERLTREVQTGFDKETGQPVMEEQEFDFQPLPFLVIVIDEMADLMLVAGKDVEATVQRLAQMARAAGIHVVMATQRPSVDVITGT
ncbi:MAG: DNA translocase FtsK 4TM domain-containing protein, partial [Alphaproteobacteria bacterium]|nr:DNA translocase FtsK 4TM domain-containing protein [Alphaproteobacteria bacterium]